MRRVSRRRGAGDRGLVSTLPQKTSAVLIGPNSELFGSKLHATRRQSEAVRRRPENPVNTRFLAFFSSQQVEPGALQSGGASGGMIGGMPHVSKRMPPIPLTDTAIRNARSRDKPFRLFDGGGLSIRNPRNPNGSLGLSLAPDQPSVLRCRLHPLKYARTTASRSFIGTGL